MQPYYSGAAANHISPRLKCGPASPRYRQNAFASCTCRGVRHSALNSADDPTMIDTHFAREGATLSLFGLYRNSIPRGASAWVEVAVE